MEIEKPRITVIMGIYNCASTLVEALESLENQTYKNFKVILCNDGSTDNTLEVAKKWVSTHSNYVLIENPHNMGLNATLNHCLKYVDTEYVARMDGDDISLPTRFEIELGFLEKNPQYAIVSTPMHYFDDQGIFMTGIGGYEPQKNDFVKSTPFCHAPCLVKKEAYDKVCGYTDEDKYMRVEDYHLWFKMYKEGYRGYMLPMPLYKMRDDRNAYKRRNFKTRKNEFFLKLEICREFKLPLSSYLYCIKPLIAFLLPRNVYDLCHRQKNK